MNEAYWLINDDTINNPVTHTTCSLRKSLMKELFSHLCLALIVILSFSSVTKAQDVLVGLTSTGGSLNGGTSFNLKTNGASFTVHRKFMNVGNYPLGDLVKGADGYFYGMTNQGGNNGSGAIFKMSSSGTITILRNLSYSDGASPHGSLLQATDGNFYGMTSSGGSKYNGTIFKITPSGTFTILKNLDGTTTGGNPYGSLVQGSDGNFYGMTYGGGTLSYGTIFKMAPDGTFTVLKNLDYNTTGGYPYGGLVEGAAGVFYGMTNQGGASNYGTIFSITSTGTFTVLKNLDNTSGTYPQGTLVKAKDGYFYGMTSQGGTYGGGTIFKIKPNGGSFVVLRHLNPATDGSTPLGSLIIQKANPVATAQSFSMVKNTTKKVKLTATGGSPLTYAIATTPLHGTATITKDTLTYTPAANYAGSDSLYFTATWGCQKSSPAKIKITVTAATVTATAISREGAMDNQQQEGQLSVKAMPNPSHSYFTLITSGSSNDPISIRVMDAMGRMIEMKENIAVNSSIILGSNYRAGLYVEVVQGNEQVVVKLLKQ